MANLLCILSCAVLLQLCNSYEYNETPRSYYNEDSEIDRILTEYRKEESDPYSATGSRRSEEEALRDPVAQETIKMPGVSPQKHDTYLCYGQKVPADEFYISFQPNAEMNTAHHMLLFGCELPYETGKAWGCGEMHPVCRSGSQHILYAWGKNAPPLKLPRGVGFKVGPSTNIKYLVLQVHYGKVQKFIGTNLKDYSGVTMDVTRKDLRLQAGIFVLAEGLAKIPPHKEKWHLDVGCRYDGKAVLHPFAARVHAHKLATVVSGYRIRNKQWALIRKETPQRPQAFYYLNKAMTIVEGDHLEARCTYNTMKKDVITNIGATMNDEMCNFYIMFFYDAKKYADEPPYMCRWGYLDDNLKFPAGSDIYEGKVPVEDPAPSKGIEKGKATFTLQPDWGSENKFGQISGVAVDNKGFVVIFHRADRSWGQSTFNADNTLQGNPGPIKTNTMAWLNAKTGKIVMQWGKDLFYLPHGLTVDHASNIWVTDVGSHQVFKFDLIKSKKPLLTLGTANKPGSDSKHFCKPTDVAVDRTGVFYVSDGYCNSRILMFSSRGQLLMEITDKTLQKSRPNILKAHEMELYGSRQELWLRKAANVKEENLMAFQGGLLPPFSFNIPHSLSLDEQKQELYVADRQNGRVLVFSALFGNLVRTITGIFGDTVYAITYKDGDLHAVSGPSKPKGFTYNVKTKKLTSWAEFTLPHDLAVSKDGNDIYVAEIGPNKLWKFRKEN